MGWTNGESENSSPDRVENFHFSISSRSALGSNQPTIQWVQRALAPPPGVKRQGRESEHSPPTSGEIKSCGYAPQLPHTPSRPGVEIMKHMDIFTFFLLLLHAYLLPHLITRFTGSVVVKALCYKPEGSGLEAR
jgi:hypothetical protein